MDIDYSLKKNIEKIVDYEIEPMTLKEDDVISILEDLVSNYHILKKEFEDYKKYIEDNYKPISIAEQVGINDRDFI